MGLRIREALGVEKADFRTRRNGERYLRLRSQASRDGRTRAPLKHRREGEGRNVPVPDFVWEMAEKMPDGPLCPGPRGTRYMPYNAARTRFAAITAALGIDDGYTTHSLRHQFASECKRRGVASDATFRNLREDSAVRDGGPSTAERRSRWESKAAGQEGRDRTVLRHMPA